MTYRVLMVTYVQPTRWLVKFFVRTVPMRCSPVFLQTNQELIALAVRIRSSPGGHEFLLNVLLGARTEDFSFDPGVSSRCAPYALCGGDRSSAQMAGPRVYTGSIEIG